MSATSPGELVHVDVTKQGRIPHGGGWRAHGRGQAARLGHQHQRHQPARLGCDYVHQMVDDHTRLAYAEIHDDDRGETAAAFTDRAIAWFAARGITIERVMTDNNSLLSLTGLWPGPGRPRRGPQAHPRLSTSDQRTRWNG